MNARDESPRPGRTYAALFGRYQAGREAETPAHEVLVGREGQRAYFIDILLRAGRRGAYLVTGNRGVGKTSFVRYCLAEYRREVFERFLRSNVGRVTFWDRTLVLVVGLICLILALLVSETMELLIVSIHQRDGAPQDILFWLLVLPLAIFCLYPLLFAREVFSEVIEGVLQKQRERGLRHGIFPASALTVGFAALLWWWGPFGAPAVGMGRIVCGLAILYLWIQLTSYRWYKGGREVSLREVLGGTTGLGRTPSGRRLPVWGAATTIVLALVAAYVLQPDSGLARRDLSPRAEVMGNLFLGLLLLGAGGFAQGLHRLWTAVRGRSQGGSSYQVIAAQRYLGVGFLVGAASLGAMLHWQIWASGTGVNLLFAAGLLFLGCHLLFVGRYDLHFEPRPLIVLSAKAILSIVVSLQLVHPLLEVWRWPPLVVHEPPPAVVSLAYSPGIVEDGLRTPVPLARQPGIFHDRDEELIWSLGLFLALLLLYLFDYEWVMRPGLFRREDGALDPGGFASAGPEAAEREQCRREAARNQAETTLPLLLYRTWLPTLTISVNLGFERLDHRRVVQAMLAGLREKYHRAFLAWNSGLANLGRLLAILLLLMLVALVGERWFRLPNLTTEELASTGADYQTICSHFQGRQKGAGAANLICKLPLGDVVFHILYYNFLSGVVSEPYQADQDHLLFYFLPFARRPWPETEGAPSPVGKPVLIEQGIHFRLYHLLLLAVFFLGARWLLQKLPFLPYHSVLKRIDEVMDSLTASTSVTSKTGRWQPVQWLHGFFVDERVRQTQQDPFDPRTVEFLFLQILEEIQKAAILLPGARNQLLSLPVPEITYVFDELDKVGVRSEPLAGGANDQMQAEIADAERRRSRELHDLLADMKNLLSSAPARFIFVGGRDLHDEWLADQTSRQPLLTNIFAAEVYLPSLLTDHGHRESGRIELQVGAYLAQQVRRAQQLHGRFNTKISLPSFTLPAEEPLEESFIQPASSSPGEACCLLDVLDPDSGERFVGRAELSRDFVQFLTYRSMGNPKRLKELLGTFVRPVGRVVQRPEARERFDCQHVLSFGDTDRFRIELLSCIYRHLGRTFERGFVQRDDKITTSVFHLADFLLKFHRRAFSWSNLERVDELVHIHRAPDLRDLLEAMVEDWSWRFLHRIRNGMYNFRFRSEFAVEIEHASRHSPEEMAAFNFTLDESQVLRSLYQATLDRFKDERSQEVRDVVAGLGELHEFDQDYETARFYYRWAISLLDGELRQVVGGSLLEKVSPIIEILGAGKPGQEHARLYMTWGIARLRLMLQAGMTYELARDLEHAAVEYQNARTLARSLLLSMLDNPGRLEASLLDAVNDEPAQGGERLHALKSLNILFQPVFAEAWVAEKLEGGVDNSLALIKRELRELRDILPFVRDPLLRLNGGRMSVRHSTFALIVAELHNKLADLYFFKGRQVVSWSDIEEQRNQDHRQPRRAHDGYLLRAHYHYAMGLHELRRFNTYRQRTSGTKLNIWADPQPWPTIGASNWPDFVYRAAGGTFNDFAEVMLGRVSLYGLFHGLNQWQGLRWGEAEGRRGRTRRKLVKLCTEWMESAMAEGDVVPIDSSPGQPDAGRYEIHIPIGSGSLFVGTLEGWLGRWNARTPVSADSLLLDFDERGGHADLGRLVLALELMNVGAQYLRRGGYVEEAAEENLKICEAVTCYLWWGLAINRIFEWVNSPPLLYNLAREQLTLNAFDHPYWGHLMKVGCQALKWADLFFRSSRRAVGGGYLVGDKIPAAAVRLACSLGLAVERWEEEIVAKGGERSGESCPRIELQATRRDIERLLRSWTGESIVPANATGSLRRILSESLLRHTYPMINRLHGLKVLIDDALLSRGARARAAFLSGESLALARQLLVQRASFDAPLHFTPLHSGSTFAFLFLAAEAQGPPEGAAPEDLEAIRRAAQEDLLRSDQMSTMRRAFYQTISSLYYLYDDFNDRQVHFHHAVRMAGSELFSMLWLLILRRLDDDRAGAAPLQLSYQTVLPLPGEQGGRAGRGTPVPEDG